MALYTINVMLLFYVVPLILSYVVIRAYYKRFLYASYPSAVEVFMVLWPAVNMVALLAYLIIYITSWVDEASEKRAEKKDKMTARSFFRL